jgi:hypothetical protein
VLNFISFQDQIWPGLDEPDQLSYSALPESADEIYLLHSLDRTDRRRQGATACSDRCSVLIALANIFPLLYVVVVNRLPPHHHQQMDRWSVLVQSMATKSPLCVSEGHLQHGARI